MRMSGSGRRRPRKGRALTLRSAAAGALRVFSHAVGTAGNGGLPSRGPISWEEMGERTPEGRGSSLWTPFSGGVVWGEAVPLTGYLACGPHSERSVTARPPAGRAGDVGRYPLRKGGEKPFRFPLFPPVNEPPLPPARAGGRAMRRWSWRPQARPLPDGTTFPRSSHQRMGFQGEGTSFPLVFFPLFLQRNRAPAGKPRFPPVPTAPEKEPPPKAQPESNLKAPAKTAIPHNILRCFPLPTPPPAR